jgi:HSP20 family protein
MTELIIWKNREINKMRKTVEQLFDRMWMDFGSSLSPAMTTLGPSVDISETANTVIVKAELPGIDINDVKISVTERTLSLMGEKRAEMARKGAQYHRLERRFGSFSRTIQLPCPINVEDIDATYEKGVLVIVLPKCGAKKGKPIKLKVT